MPFIVQAIIAVVTAIGSAVATVAAYAGVAGGLLGGAMGLSSAGILAMSTAFSALAVGGLAMGLMAGLSALFPQHSTVGGNGIAFKADPSAGYPLVVGRTGVGGNIIFAQTSNDKNNTWLHYFTVLSHGPVDAIEGFSANNVPVSFNADGTVSNIGLNWRGAYNAGVSYAVNDGVGYLGTNYICVAPSLGYATSDTNHWAVAGSYAGPKWTSAMWQLQSKGAQPDVILPAPSGTGSLPEWTSVNKLSGLAHTRWVLKYDSAAYPTGSPKPIWVVRGPPVYDPRLDSTYPGGSGPQRLGAPSTWVFSTNPYIQALNWCLGYFANGTRVLGLGAPVTGIDVAAFVTGANVADANGWGCGGQVFSTDSKWDVFTQMLAAGAGFPTRKGALISCIVDTPRVSIATVTGADFTGAVNVQAMSARKDRINQVVATYRSEAHQWQGVQAAPVKVPAYIAADGTVRSKGVQMALVQGVNQSAALARYIIEDSREFGPITGPMLPKWMGLSPGDCITVNEPEFGLNGQLILILDRKVDPMNGSVTITARSETTQKHSFALGQTGVAPSAPALTGLNLVSDAPNAPPWAAVGQTLTANGVSTPAIVVTGTVENVNASNVIIRTRQSAGPGPWSHYDSPPAPVAVRTEITSLGSGEVRDIGISYLVKGIQGAELVIPNVTAGTFAGSGAGGVVTPTPALTWPSMVAGGAGIQTATSAAQTILGITAPITLTLTFTGAGSFSYIHNGGASTPFTSGATVVVGAGDTLSFTVTASSTASGVLSISNASNSGALISAPTYALTVTGAGQVPSPTPAWGGLYAFNQNSVPAFQSDTPATISGITAAISLTVTWTSLGPNAATIQWSSNGGAWTTISSGATITANPGDTIAFAASMSAVGTAYGAITVANASSGGTVLCTFSYSVIIIAGSLGGFL